jgi:hypothetical protein
MLAQKQGIKKYQEWIPEVSTAVSFLDCFGLVDYFK